jgi:Integrase core domain
MPMWSACIARLTRNGGLVRLPTTLGEVREATEEFLQHYNHERPHQGTACGNRPPHTAFPNLPALPPVPVRVTPDRWLETVQGQAFARKVGADGSVDVDDEHYYIGQAYAGKQVVLFVNAPEKVFGVWLDGHVIKSVPIKGLFGREMRWEEYMAFIEQQARSRSTSFAGQAAQDAPTLAFACEIPTGCCPCVIN